MTTIINYLKDAQLVANFQNFFGIHLIENLNNGQIDNLTDNKLEQKNKLTNGFIKTDHNGELKNRHLTSSLIETSSIINDQSKLIKKNYKIDNLVFYYLFSFGASLGYEAFYALFFPYFLHSIDSYVGRRLIFIWVIVMYIGQALKDIIRWNRPKSPPVVVLEPEYSVEYGFPSTHAMVGFALPFSIFIFTNSRYVYPFWFGFTIASIWCILVCGSRLYLGMHTVLDVLAGLLLSSSILFICAPIIDQIDKFNLEAYSAPLIGFLIVSAMSIYYPKSDRWSPARGDTCVMVGFGYGVQVGSWLNFQLNCMTDPNLSIPFEINWPTRQKIINSLLRTLFAAITVELCRMLGKKLLYPILCKINNINSKNLESKKEPCIEVPQKLIIYTLIGIHICFSLPILFNYLNI